MFRLLINSGILIFIIPILGLQCKKDKFNGYDLRFKVQNNSSNTISYFDNANNYPDTSISYISDQFLKANDYYSITPEKNRIIYTTGTSWEQIFNQAPEGIVMLYIINTDLIKNNPWDSIQNQYNILARYDLSIEDLKHRNFTIEYPYNSSLGKLKVWTKK